MKSCRVRLPAALVAALLVPVLASAGPGAVYVGLGAQYASTHAPAEDPRPPGSSGAGVGGLRFADGRTRERAFVGVDVAPDWQIEAAYQAFGRFRSDPVYVFSPTSGVVGYGGRAELRVRAFSLGVRFSRPVGAGWRAGLEAGVARATFDASGALLLPFPAAFGGGAARVPFASPAGRTGWTWGVGVARDLGPHWRATLAYRQYRLEVLRLESAGLDAAWRF
jgi:opacity protein-like surface antigen